MWLIHSIRKFMEDGQDPCIIFLREGRMGAAEVIVKLVGRRIENR